jgi:hypothetical protein
MPEALNQFALESLADSLETMAFLSPNPIEHPQCPPTDAIMISMRIEGETSGIIEMVASRNLGKLAICNMLGEDPASMVQYEDALKELLNTFAGLILRRGSDGARKTTQMSLPTIRPFDGDYWAKFVAAPGAVVVEVEGNPVAIRVRADRRNRENS